MSLDLQFLGNKLRKCRELLQFSILEVSHSTGIDGDGIKSFEQGKLEPLGDEILTLSDLYKEDYKLFTSSEQKSVTEKIEVLFRKFESNFLKNDRWAIRKFLSLCKCEEDIFDDFRKIGAHIFRRRLNKSDIPDLFVPTHNHG